mmetsp:Transcript_108421/g.162223  ORF Transcript_108421/g.162223 Transcript_108421/m.162223 type:complete len:87 (-) Transcript_108421:113-373(-)
MAFNSTGPTRLQTTGLKVRSRRFVSTHSRTGLARERILSTGDQYTCDEQRAEALESWRASKRVDTDWVYVQGPTGALLPGTLLRTG